MNNLSVLMVINTTGLQYDDRLRKEVGSLRALGADVRILGLEYANTAGQRAVYDGVPATTIHLRSRGWFKQGRGLVAKTAEMYLRFAASIVSRRPDVVWCHDMEMSGFVPVLALLRLFGLVRFVVWDQHELPSDARMQGKSYRRVYSTLIGLCDHIVMANQERRALVLEWLGGEPKAPIAVLENYPDARFSELRIDDLPDTVAAWLGDSPYLLAQGGANPDRHLNNLVAAVLRHPRFKLVVVGPYLPHVLTNLQQVHGDELAARVLFTGPVPQMELTRFIDHAYASVVLYQAHSANTRLCAPNRMYQALARAVPVLVGSNPPMAGLVNATRCGVVLKTDGGDVDDLCDGLQRLEAGYDECSEQAAEPRDLLWESQNAVIARTIESLVYGTYENSLSAAGLERR
jgi:glycosyltransferase involved in cell wall biosynthesis